MQFRWQRCDDVGAWQQPRGRGKACNLQGKTPAAMAREQQPVEIGVLVLEGEEFEVMDLIVGDTKEITPVSLP